MFALRIHSLSQLVTVCNRGQRFLRGAEMSNISIIRDNGCVVVGLDGQIVAVGTNEAVLQQLPSGATFSIDINGTGKSVIPGLVDAHTHPVWAGDRAHEFAMKLEGATYAQVHASGGGINHTVEHTRMASEDELLGQLLDRLGEMLKTGTTTAEAKSGYGLDTPTEVKMLRVIKRAKSLQPIDLVGNFCGAHSVPKGMTAEQATDVIVNEMIPAIVEAKARGEIDPELCDVFHEKGFFEHADTRRIIAAAKGVGLEVNFHGDELYPMQSGELAGEFGCLAVSHLEHVSEEGRRAMAKRPTIAVLLPTTAYVLRLVPPPARALIESEVPVALGSDFCPNAYCMSMPITMNLACVNMKMTMSEALAAATINAAASILRSHSHGSIEVGKVGDLILLDAPNWEHLIYRIGHPPIETVIKKGRIAWSAAKSQRVVVAKANKADDPRIGSLLTPGISGDVVLLGYPNDEGVHRNGGRVGAAMGPKAVRSFLGPMGAVRNSERDVDLTGLKFSDAGDIGLGQSLERAHESLSQAVQLLTSQGKVPIVVGGGNDQSYPNALGLLRAHPGKKSAVINVDAHLDVRPMIMDGSQQYAHSGSPFRQLLEDPLFENGYFVEFGAQGTQCSKDHVDYIRSRPKQQCSIMWLTELQRDGVVARFSTLLASLPQDVIAFLSFDIDSIKSADCPGVSCPSNFGITAEEAVEMCFIAGKDPRVKLFDLSELNPIIEDYRTPRLVVQMIVHFLMGYRLRQIG